MRPNRAAAASTTPSNRRCSLVLAQWLEHPEHDGGQEGRAHQQQRMFCPATSVENASAVGENRRAKPAEPSDLAHPLAPRAVTALVNVNAGPLIRRPSPGMLRPKVCVGAV